MKILVARTDRLGDLVLSLPVFAAGRAARPDWEFHALVAPAGVPLVEHDPAVAGVWTWSGADDPDADATLVGRLREEGFDAAVLLQFRAPLARLLRRAGISRLHGPWSKPASWWLLNRGTWQHRSRGGRHEMDLNLDLLARLPGLGPLRAVRPQVHLGEAQRALGAAFRASEAAGAATVAYVHPGSGGSALDWPPDRFAALAGQLAARPGWRVFVTGQGGDARAVRAMQAAGLDPRVGILLDRYDLRGFLGVLAAGDVLVGPSTGPLHLAAALDLATVGLYPPVPAMSPRRWGPRGRWNRTLVPEVECPGRHACRLERCPLHNCLERVDAAAVAAAVDEVVGERAGTPRGPTKAVEE